MAITGGTAPSATPPACGGCPQPAGDRRRTRHQAGQRACTKRGGGKQEEKGGIVLIRHFTSKSLVKKWSHPSLECICRTKSDAEERFLAVLSVLMIYAYLFCCGERSLHGVVDS